jgi:hypothetical protein
MAQSTRVVFYNGTQGIFSEIKGAIEFNTVFFKLYVHIPTYI